MIRHDVQAQTFISILVCCSANQVVSLYLQKYRLRQEYGHQKKVVVVGLATKRPAVWLFCGASCGARVSHVAREVCQVSRVSGLLFIAMFVYTLQINTSSSTKRAVVCKKLI